MTFTTKPLGAALRLEIEADPLPGELTNLVPNPNGELGGWGWVVPTWYATMDGYPNDWGVDALRYHPYGLLEPGPVPSTPQYFASDPMTVAVGQYVAAAWRLPVSGGLYVRVRFEWLDVDGAVIGASTQSPYVGGASTGSYNLGPFVVPAGTAQARLRFDVYSDTAGTGPNAYGPVVYLDHVTVAMAPTSTALGTIITNVVTNPSFEVDLSGWQADSGSLLRVTAEHAVGAAAVRITQTVGGQPGIRSAVRYPIEPSRYYNVSAYMKRAPLGGGQESAPVAMRIDWFSGASSVRVDLFTNIDTAAASWKRVDRTVTSPADADGVQVRIYFQTTNSFGASVFYVDGVQVLLGDTVQPFIDGSVSSSSLSYIGRVFTNLLGTTHDISATREGMNVGTLDAHIVDSSLDPSQSTLLRPGKALRLIARDSAGVWSPVFTGATTHAVVEYVLRREDETKRADITLSAVDNVQRLANQARSEGVERVQDLTYVLAGCGVPWNLNGSGTSGPTEVIVVSDSDNASALDQVGVTRDSQHGLAWVNRAGVVCVVDEAHRSSTPVGALGPDTYIDVGVGYDSELLMNELTLTYLYDGSSSDTFGPYRNESSIETWGVAHADMTIHGIGDDDATLTGFATEVLTANGTPAVRLNSMQLHVDVSPDWTAIASWFAWLDLYDLVDVTYARDRVGPRAPDEPVRVSRISHTISAPDSKWQIELGFTGADRISLPTTASGASVGGLGGGGGSGGGGGGTIYTAGPGLSLTGNDFAVNVDGVGIEIAADTLRLKDGGVTSAKIADGTIQAGDLAAGVVPDDALLLHKSGVETADGRKTFTGGDGTAVGANGSSIVAKSTTDRASIRIERADGQGASLRFNQFGVVDLMNNDGSGYQGQFRAGELYDNNKRVYSENYPPPSAGVPVNLPVESWVKDPVRAVYVGTNDPTFSAPNIVDGVTLAVGDRVLKATPGGAASNGIYTVTTVGTGSNGAWTRAGDASTAARLAAAEVGVKEGTLYAGARFTTPWRGAADTLGATLMTWTCALDQDTGWLGMSLIGGWTAYDSRVPQYRRLNGVVYLKGVIKGTSLGNAFFVMPVGFRMGVAVSFEGDWTTVCSGGVAQVIHDAASGNLSVQGITTGSNPLAYTYLTGVVYTADS